MLTRRTWPIIGIAVALSIGIGAAAIYYTHEPPSSELSLSNYPELFGEGAMIIVGASASQAELETAEAIATNLGEITGTRPAIRKDGDVSENDKPDHNLILVGMPNSNEVLQEVYYVTNATRVTEEYPGQNKGILEILRNPWNEERVMLLVVGSDERGVKMVSETVRNAQNLDVPKITVPFSGIFCYSAVAGPYVVFLTCEGETYYVGDGLKFLEKANDNEFMPHIPPHAYEIPIQTWDLWTHELNGTVEIVNPKITEGTIKLGYDPCQGDVKKVENLVTRADKLVQISLSECITCEGGA